jgi:NAD(P)-dependent dehydrogenase (short-subunit alcohol dehydrogenase family)
VSRKLVGLKAVEAKIIADGGKAFSISCNTGNMNEINDLFVQIEEKYGRLNYLVNNSATNPFFGQNMDATDDAWEKTFSVNLKGYFFMIQHAAKLMKEQGGGSIVNVSSVNGIRPAPFQGMYSITKAGVIAMTKSFAKELAPLKIRVNALLPGMTDTKFSAAITGNPDIMNKIVLPQIPMARVAQPDEMSGAAAWLLSDAASFTTGATIVVDGGMLA